MVLHRPVELARITGHVVLADFHFSDYGVNQDFAEFDPHLAAPKTPRIWSLSTESESEGYFGA